MSPILFISMLPLTPNGSSRVSCGATEEMCVSRRKSSRNMYGELPIERFRLYITPNVIYDVDQKTGVTVFGTRRYRELDDPVNERAIGATYDACGDLSSVSGEIYCSPSLTICDDRKGSAQILGFRQKLVALNAGRQRQVSRLD